MAEEAKMKSLKGLKKEGKKLHLDSDNSPSRPHVTSESKYFQLPGRRRRKGPGRPVGDLTIRRTSAQGNKTS